MRSHVLIAERRNIWHFRPLGCCHHCHYCHQKLQPLGGAVWQWCSLFATSLPVDSRLIYALFVCLFLSFVRVLRWMFDLSPDYKPKCHRFLLRSIRLGFGKSPSLKKISKSIQSLVAILHFQQVIIRAKHLPIWGWELKSVRPKKYRLSADFKCQQHPRWFVFSGLI